ncbi:DUF4326 domain-containing protein [Spongiactinospora sp. TRM90649]|uniref:DUF4326 domain-containing protein n=1 Tax=Spongiactinospora sp. TRM90649 TaxID=3031114 RepID=UPI0023F92F7F|nr:DUF4326 domain-containing protein [Spongiactinospora sp. TRM90649]MDF5756735.1 DUF4326 domain-containing protein [Spongiactinospora sp. TRM90649]
MPRRVRVEGDLYHGHVPEGAVYVGRPAPGLNASPFNNPHTLPTKKGKGCRTCGRRHTRHEMMVLYREHLREHPELVERARRELAGRDLACWCAPDKECHADILVGVLAGEDP